MLFFLQKMAKIIFSRSIYNIKIVTIFLKVFSIKSHLQNLNFKQSKNQPCNSLTGTLDFFQKECNMKLQLDKQSHNNCPQKISYRKYYVHLIYFLASENHLNPLLSTELLARGDFIGFMVPKFCAQRLNKICPNFLKLVQTCAMFGLVDFCFKLSRLF